eukprot:941624_1
MSPLSQEATIDSEELKDGDIYESVRRKNLPSNPEQMERNALREQYHRFVQANDYFNAWKIAKQLIECDDPQGYNHRTFSERAIPLFHTTESFTKRRCHQITRQITLRIITDIDIRHQ